MSKNNNKKSMTFLGYIFSSKGIWFWAVIVTVIVTSFIVLIESEASSVLVYPRYLLGFAFVLILPGFALIKILFPIKGLDFFESLTLSIGISLAIVPLVVLILNFTPWGIGTYSVTMGLLMFTILLAIVAEIRGYQAIHK